MSSSNNSTASVDVCIFYLINFVLKTELFRHWPKYFVVLFVWKNYVMLVFVLIVLSYVVIHVFE